MVDDFPGRFDPYIGGEESFFDFIEIVFADIAENLSDFPNRGENDRRGPPKALSELVDKSFDHSHMADSLLNISSPSIVCRGGHFFDRRNRRG